MELSKALKTDEKNFDKLFFILNPGGQNKGEKKGDESLGKERGNRDGVKSYPGKHSRRLKGGKT